jgi:predicted dehydrogenase
MSGSTRRQLLQWTAAAAAAIAAAPHLRAQENTERVAVAVMGMGRGSDLATALAAIPNVFVKYVCDTDQTRANAAAKNIGAKAAKNNDTPGPAPIQDFRRILEDKEIAAVAIATPDHWHAPAAILAASAGKHVYVEKPCCHNPREGELLVEAQKKFNRVIQHGTQRRSWPGNREGIEKLKEGVIGRVLFSRGWYANNRPSIGRGKPAAAPANLDWSLWQGPAPEKEFHDNYVHYNWHWFWHWGTGECGNNGIHALDLCRWGLGVECPTKVTSAGGRYHFDDDWQTPDTQFATFEFEGGKVIHWEGQSCHPRGVENNSGFGAAFYGDKGTMIIDGGYTVYDLKNKEVAKVGGGGGDIVHMRNFIGALRANDQSKLNAPIAEGYKSVLLCHLANISQRMGRVIHVDAASMRIKDDAEAARLWSREYRSGWEPKV